jgi:hypothetical protein
MVITAHIDQWDGPLTFEKMGYNKKQLKEPTKPLYGFGGKRIESIRVIALPVFFGTPTPRMHNL